MKLTASLRYLACGDAFDGEDENMRIAGATLQSITYALCKMIIKYFGPQSLNRYLDEKERRIMSAAMADKGFPGCLGSWDCKHFVWKNCPDRLAGQHKGHGEGGRKTLILKAICDHRKCIWSANFGEEGSLNDLNVLD